MLFLFQNIRPYFFSWFAKVTYEKSSTRGNQTRKILQKNIRHDYLFIFFFEGKKMQTNSYSYGYYENFRKNIASRIVGGFE